MAKRGKRYQELVKDFNRETFYEPAEALAIVKEKANAKFDEYCIVSRYTIQYGRCH